MPFEPTRLKSLREAKRLSQEDLAKLSGVSQSVVTRSERGESAPRSDAMEKLALALDCSLDYLHGLTHAGETAAAAAALMSFDVFSKMPQFSDEQRIRCSRALNHPDAPKSANAWRVLAEIIEMAIGPTPSQTANLTLVKPRSTRTRSRK